MKKFFKRSSDGSYYYNLPDGQCLEVSGSLTGCGFITLEVSKDNKDFVSVDIPMAVAKELRRLLNRFIDDASYDKAEYEELKAYAQGAGYTEDEVQDFLSVDHPDQYLRSFANRKAKKLHSYQPTNTNEDIPF